MTPPPPPPSDEVHHPSTMDIEEISKQLVAGDSASSELLQDGVRKLKDMQAQWSTKQSALLYLSILFLASMTSLEGQVTYLFVPYITSAFKAHALLSTIQIISAVLQTILKAPTAKVADVFGRPEALSVGVLFYVVGYICMACSQSIWWYAASQIFYVGGTTGVQFLTQLIVADTSSLVNRALISSIPFIPFLWTVWAGPPLGEALLNNLGWRWGVGIWAFIIPIAAIPLIAIMFHHQRRVKEESFPYALKESFLPHTPSTEHSNVDIPLNEEAKPTWMFRTMEKIGHYLRKAWNACVRFPGELWRGLVRFSQGFVHTLIWLGHGFTRCVVWLWHSPVKVWRSLPKVWRYLIDWRSRGNDLKRGMRKVWRGMARVYCTVVYYGGQMDVPGTLIASAGLALLLVPLTLANKPTHSWASIVIIVPIGIGTLMCIAFVFYELHVARTPLVSLRLLKNRSVLFACLGGFFYFFSYYVGRTYFLSYLQVAAHVRPSQAGYINNAMNFTSTGVGVLTGVAIKFVKSIRPFIFAGSLVYIVGLGMLVFFRRPHTAIWAMVISQVVLGMGGGLFSTPNTVYVQSHASAQDLSAATALILVITTLGWSTGSAVAGAIWTNTLEPRLKQTLPDGLEQEAHAIASDMTVAMSYPIGSDARHAIDNSYFYSMRLLCIIGVGLGVCLLICVTTYRKSRPMEKVKDQENNLV